jgi:hypothetical protein
MPQVAAIPLFTVFAGGAATTITLGAVAGYLATTAITSWAISALTPKPDLGNIGGSRGTLVNSVDPAAPHEYVYGLYRKGGIRTYTESTGENNKFLHMIITIAGYEIEEFVDFYINDEIVTVDGNGFVTSSPWNSKIRIKAHRGNQTAPDPDLLAESEQIGSNFIGFGIAYMYVRLEYDQDVFANGIPLFTALVKGHKVYDPRTNSTAYSANAALCIRDYINSDYGLDDHYIDDVSFAASANVCDELVSLAGGGSQKRYEANGVVSADMTPQEIVNRLITSCAGTLFWGQGNFQLKAGYYTNPVKTFTLDDIRSTISIDTRIASRDNFNRIVGTFADADVDYIVSEYPAIESATFLAEDNGIENTLDLQFPFTTSAAMAQRLAKLTLYRGREQITFSADFGLSAFGVQAGDIVALTMDRYGWDAKPFEITGWNFKYEEGELRISMTLRETSAAAFNWAAEETDIIYNNTNLPNAYDVPLPTLNAAQASVDINEDGTAVPSIRFSWSVTDNSRVEYYDFQWKLSTDSVWQSAQVGGLEYILSPAINGASYDYRVRAVNQLGVRSDFAVSGSAAQPTADATVPNAPSNVSAAGGYGSAFVTWDAPTQNTDASTISDLFRFNIYRGLSTNPTTKVGTSSGVSFSDNNLLDATQYYYRVTAVDFTGNESAYSSNATATTNAAPQDGQDGVAGDTVVTGQVFFQTLQSSQPATPSATSYNVSTGAFTGLSSGWAVTQPSVEITDTTVKEWSATFQVVIDGATSAQTITFSAPQGAIQVTADIQSDNYVSGVSGWSIERDTGNAQFNDVTVRGDIINLSQNNVEGLAGSWYAFTNLGSGMSINSALDGAGLYSFILIGAGGGGGRSTNLGGGDYGISSGGGGGACAIFTYEWNGSTALTLTLGSGGAIPTGTPPSGQITYGTAGANSRFFIGGTEYARASGGGAGGTGFNVGSVSGGAGGTAINYSGPFGQFIARTGGNGGSGLHLGAYGGGGGVNWLGKGANGGNSFGNFTVGASGGPLGSASGGSVAVDPNGTHDLLGSYFGTKTPSYITAGNGNFLCGSNAYGGGGGSGSGGQGILFWSKL